MFPLSDSVRSSKFPIVNILLIAATVFVFIKEITAPNIDIFIQSYALISAAIRFDNYMSLLPFVTAIFLHGGFLHIVSNMWFLWVFGDNVEGNMNPVTYLFLYIAAGVAGNAVQYFLMPTSTIPLLGASGAVAGVLGAYYELFPHARIKTLVPFFTLFTIVDIPAPFMLGYWFILQIISGTASLTSIGQAGGVAFWAHVGGFIAGLLLAKILARRDFVVYE